MYILGYDKKRRLYLRDIYEIRSKMWIGMKAIIRQKDAIWTDKIVKVPATVCALNEHTFTVKRPDVYGGVIRESFKYVDLFLKDSGIEVIW